MRRFHILNIGLILGFSVLAFLTMGYHPGIEDDGVYLSGIKSDLNPALYPHDAEFFRVELQATMFDNWVAGFVRLTHVSVATAELLWQFASIALILFACWSIATRLFDDAHARWAGVALVGAMLTLPVAGTALTLADQHLHPRNVATAFILLAVDRLLAERRLQAAGLLAIAFLLHPIMAVLGLSFCFWIALTELKPVHLWLRAIRGAIRSSMTPDSLAAAAPLGWVLASPSSSWREALQTRRFYFLFQWTWYEWLGALGPLVLFWLLSRFALHRGETRLARFAMAVFTYGVFQQLAAMAIAASPALERITPLQPMRYLHLVYFFLVLMAGCLIGKYLLKAAAWRWAAFLLAINVAMLGSQRMLFAASPHLELPAMQPANSWLQAFLWIRESTPADAYFVLDPRYLAAPGEDYHSFRALAERSQLADGIKDTAMVTQVPDLGPEWQRQVASQAGWPNFQLADFERLKAEFGVTWTLVSFPQPSGLDCKWHNSALAVCRIP